MLEDGMAMNAKPGTHVPPGARPAQGQPRMSRHGQPNTASGRRLHMVVIACTTFELKRHNASHTDTVEMHKILYGRRE